ncbi:MAG: DUF4190 domain-containing protein [Candidatus Pristimantibacillus sp.]
MNNNHSEPHYNLPDPQPPYPQKSNGKAVVALVLGILSIVLSIIFFVFPFIGLFLGIPAIILGAIALKETTRSGEQGRGYAIAGLVCGIIGTLLCIIVILFIVIAYMSFGSVNVSHS